MKRINLNNFVIFAIELDPSPELVTQLYHEINVSGILSLLIQNIGKLEFEVGRVFYFIKIHLF